MPRIGDFENFAFIVGAPRCGTTTMSRMIGAHPEIAVPFVKEPHFFTLHDLRGLPDAELRTRIEHDYLDHFFSRPVPPQRIGLDGSVSYLYTPERLEPVLKIWPNARFIVGVRNPMTLLPSLHRRLIYVGDETILRFNDAWAATPDRAAGRRIPRSCIDPRLLRYDEVGRFASYLERLYASVGRERCLVVVFDDLVADPAREHRRILDFLGLDPVELGNVGAERESRGVRYHWLQRLLKRPPKFLHPYLAGIQYRRRFLRGGGKHLADRELPEKPLSLRKRILEWNAVERPSDPISPEVQKEIRLHFRNEIDRLGTLIGRDLSHWLQPLANQQKTAEPLP